MRAAKATLRPSASVEPLLASLAQTSDFLLKHGVGIADGQLAQSDACQVLALMDRLIAGLCSYREQVKAQTDHPSIRREA